MTTLELFNDFDNLPITTPHGIIYTSSGNKVRWVQQAVAQDDTGQEVGQGVLCQWFKEPTEADSKDFLDRFAELNGKTLLSSNSKYLADEEIGAAIMEILITDFPKEVQERISLIHHASSRDRDRAPVMRKPRGLQ